MTGWWRTNAVALGALVVLAPALVGVVAWNEWSQHDSGRPVHVDTGGSATYGKIAAARKLGIEVILLRRPSLPDLASAASVGDVVAMVDHLLELAEKRGV